MSNRASVAWASFPQVARQVFFAKILSAVWLLMVFSTWMEVLTPRGISFASLLAWSAPQFAILLVLLANFWGIKRLSRGPSLVAVIPVLGIAAIFTWSFAEAIVKEGGIIRALNMAHEYAAFAGLIAAWICLILYGIAAWSVRKLRDKELRNVFD